MSEYFRILNRVEEEHADADLNEGSKRLLDGAAKEAKPAAPKRNKNKAPAPRNDAQRTATATPATTPAKPIVRKKAARAHRPEDRSASFARTFDNLRAIAAESGLTRIVIAGASAGEDVDSVIEGLAAQAERHQLTAVFSELDETGNGYVLRERSRYGAGGPATEPANFRLTSGTAPDAFDAWLDRTLQASDMVMIKAPGLGQSVDAALLARNTDGIIVVVESDVTTKEDLKLAVERVRSVGCRVLGLIASGTEDDTPAWLRQITG